MCDDAQPGVGEVERSILWPSVGGEDLHPPTPLTWRVGRSVPLAAPPVTGPPASPPGGGPEVSVPDAPPPVVLPDAAVPAAAPVAAPTPGPRDRDRGLLARTGLDGLHVLLPIGMLVLGLGLALHVLTTPTGDRPRP